MRATMLSAILFALFLFIPVASAEPITPLPEAAAECDDAGGIPCGPINAIMTIVLEKSRNIRFGDSDVFETKGKLSYYFDVDADGYWYDMNKEIWVTFAVTKQPPWLQATITPPKMKIPYRPSECPSCLQPEGSDPGQLMFYWEGDVSVKVQKLRDYQPAELKKWLKSDGTYRLTFSASSTDSQLPTQTGAGIQEGYAPKDLKFRPELANNVKTQSGDTKVYAPSTGLVAVAAAAAVAVIFFARRK